MSRTFTSRDGTTLDWDDRLGILDHVVEKLVAQGKRSVDGTSCLYRAGDGSACAAGWLMPDSIVPEAALNAKTFRTLYRSSSSVFTHFGTLDESDIEFVSLLQTVHDLSSSWPDIKLAYAPMRANLVKEKESE